MKFILENRFTRGK